MTFTSFSDQLHFALFRDDEEETSGRRRRREPRRDGIVLPRSSPSSDCGVPLFAARTLIDTSNSGSPTAGRLHHGLRSVGFLPSEPFDLESSSLVCIKYV